MAGTVLGPSSSTEPRRAPSGAATRHELQERTSIKCAVPESRAPCWGRPAAPSRGAPPAALPPGCRAAALLPPGSFADRLQTLTDLCITPYAKSRYADKAAAPQSSCRQARPQPSRSESFTGLGNCRSKLPSAEIVRTNECCRLVGGFQTALATAKARHHVIHLLAGRRLLAPAAAAATPRQRSPAAAAVGP